MLACSISAHSVFERDVAGVHPRPSLRDADAVPGPGVVDGRCRGSATALVARRWTFTPSRTWSVALPGSVPDRVVRTLTSGSTWSRSQALPGFVPALVARAPTGTGQAASHRALPGFSSGPRCAQPYGTRGGIPYQCCRGSSPALVARGPTARAPRKSGGDVAGVRPRPSLRDRPAPAGAAHRPGRCRVRPGPRCAQLPQTWIQVDNAALPGAGPGPRCAWLAADKTIGGFRKVLPGFGPALVARWTRGHSRTPRTGVAGRPPGPRCAMTLDLKQLLESDGRCRGPTPALVVRTCGRCNGRTA